MASLSGLLLLAWLKNRTIVLLSGMPLQLSTAISSLGCMLVGNNNPLEES
jgi:hypothetical protein